MSTKAGRKAPETVDEQIEVLVSRKENKTWTFGPKGQELTYIQRPLGWLAKLEFFSIVGRIVDQMMSGPDGITVNTLVNTMRGPRERSGQLTMQDFMDADSLVQGLSRIIGYSPDVVEDLYCLWLSVPRGEYELAKEYMRMPPEKGGLRDEDGIQIIETFIDQNAKAIEELFREALPGFVKRVRNETTLGQGDK